MSEFSKLCRACLSAIDTFRYYLFEDVSPDVYWFCTNIEVMKDEILPKSICNTCYDLIQKFSEFKKTCLQSQNTLLNYYSVEKEKKKLDWLNNDSRELDTKKDILDNCVNKYDGVIVKEEQVEAHYDDDIDPTELPIEFNAEVEINQSHKDVKVKTKERIKLKCDLCSRSFVSRKRFEIHKITHQTKNIFKCTSCNKSFVTWSGLRRHHESWHVRVPLSSVKCRTCGKIAKSRETLRIHEKLHQERRNFLICNVCGKGCSTSAVLKAHLETHKDNRERHYTCEHCGKKFYTNKVLVAHVQKCHTGRRYICQICSFPFTDKYNLAKHLLNHEGKGRAFKCEVCNKSYTSKTTYVEHQRTHSGERPYVCTYCSKSFPSKKRLAEHHLTHTGEKPHKCSVCDHTFSQRGSLTRHMKIHDRIVPVGN